MSAESTVAFFGVRFEMSKDDIYLLEERSYPLLAKARHNGLKTYWGNFGLRGDMYLLFVGDKLGVLGVENDHHVQLTARELANRAEDTRKKLRQAGIEDEPKLHLAWQPDVH